MAYLGKCLEIIFVEKRSKTVLRIMTTKKARRDERTSAQIKTINDRAYRYLSCLLVLFCPLLFSSHVMKRRELVFLIYSLH